MELEHEVKTNFHMNLRCFSCFALFYSTIYQDSLIIFLHFLITYVIGMTSNIKNRAVNILIYLFLQHYFHILYPKSFTFVFLQKVIPNYIICTVKYLRFVSK